MIWYIIPARKNSKGVPYKNRELFNFTASTIPKDLKKQVIVTSDDEVVQNLAKQHGFKVRERPAEISKDDTNIRDYICMVNVGFLSMVDKNLVSEQTVFMKIDDPIDINTRQDIEKMLKTKDKK